MLTNASSKIAQMSFCQLHLLQRYLRVRIYNRETAIYPYIRRRLVTFNAMGIFPANNMVGVNCFMCDRTLLRVP